MTREDALAMVDRARESAECLLIEGKLSYTSASSDCPTYMWLAALAEELGEVARCIHDEAPADVLAQELAQLAGVAVGRLEAIDLDQLTLG